MQNIRIIAVFITLLFSSQAFSQTVAKYIVYFKDKNSSTFNPYTYFDKKAIERRITNDIALIDSSDFPVNENYITEIKKHSENYKATSRWLNASIIFANELQINTIKKLSFVKEVEILNQENKSILLAVKKQKESKKLSDKEIDLLHLQIDRMQGKQFSKGLVFGKGVRVAVFDAGFPGVDKIEEFKHLRENKKIIDTYDFVKNKKNVYDFNAHGTNTLSCVGGISQQGTIGLATEAEFLLARTENATFEPFSEEENWLAAAEWADKNGAQIISSSLGYTNSRYFRKDMNGHTSLVAKAARMATRKGMLVVNSAGNDGDNKWHIMGTPADVDSVLSVGGIHPKTNIHTSFSSFGPVRGSSVKPNVTAMAHVIAAGPNGLGETQGTSFSCPLVAGFAACVLQLNPKLKVMELFEIIEKSSDLYPYFDYAHGYGVPQASYFIDRDTTTIDLPKITIDESNFKISAFISDDDLKKLNSKNNKLFYHIENSDGSLHSYSVIKVTSSKPFEIAFMDIDNGQKLVIFFNGFLYSKEF